MSNLTNYCDFAMVPAYCKSGCLGNICFLKYLKTRNVKRIIIKFLLVTGVSPGTAILLPETSYNPEQHLSFSCCCDVLVSSLHGRHFTFELIHQRQ